jgi:hypothetical protein
VAVDVLEVRYRTGYYEVARVAVHSPPRGPGITVSGWMYLSTLERIPFVPDGGWSRIAAADLAFIGPSSSETVSDDDDLWIRR